ncbi:hypothetical protein [Bacillus rhizoplanae]|uniref:hypothetical protein n=1 Tax=Bacillus rhizoplanae TaxID=2880966 RepID=UPI003D1C260B
MFSRVNSKKEYIYTVIIIALGVGLFNISRTIWWLYTMAFLLFLSTFIFKKPTKKQILIDIVGLVLMCFIFWFGERFFK